MSGCSSLFGSTDALHWQTSDSGRPVLSNDKHPLSANPEISTTAAGKKALCLLLPNHILSLCFKANVMLEYSIAEAEALLSKNLKAAQKNLAEIEEDLGFLRDQYTTTEVSILFV